MKHLDFVKSNILFNKLNEDSKKYNINYSETGDKKYINLIISQYIHGLDKIVEIIDMIDELDDLDIVYKKIEDLDKLINNIYKI